MSEAKHTPGPWKLSKYGANVTDKNGDRVCEIIERQSLYRNLTQEQLDAIREANARLIAAAPELLAACQEALVMVDEAYVATGYFKVAKSSEQRMRLEQAIAKATA